MNVIRHRIRDWLWARMTALGLIRAAAFVIFVIRPGNLRVLGSGLLVFSPGALVGTLVATTPRGLGGAGLLPVAVRPERKVRGNAKLLSDSTRSCLYRAFGRCIGYGLGVWPGIPVPIGLWYPPHPESAQMATSSTPNPGFRQVAFLRCR